MDESIYYLHFYDITGFSFADLVLKDKIFVYDLAHQRVGWANYDCKLNRVNVPPFVPAIHIAYVELYMNFHFPGSTSVNVSITSSKDFINAGQLSMSSSSREMFFKMMPIGFIALLLLHTAIFVEFQFL